MVHHQHRGAALFGCQPAGPLEGGGVADRRKPLPIPHAERAGAVGAREVGLLPAEVEEDCLRKIVLDNQRGPIEAVLDQIRGGLLGVGEHVSALEANGHETANRVDAKEQGEKVPLSRRPGPSDPAVARHSAAPVLDFPQP
jgi:hypothetical protein